MELPLECLRVERAGKVAVVTLAREARLNAWTTRMGVELFGTLRELDDDDEVRAIVVTGAGRAFCAGADLETGGSTFSRERAWEESGRLEARVRPWNVRTPILAAINGPAVGIGATLPLHWDLRIASERARIGFVFVRRGIVPEAHSTWLLPRLIGAAKAFDLLLTGRTLDAHEALAYGLVSRVVPHDRLLSEALSIATELAEHTSPVAVATTRRLLWRQLMQPDPRAARRIEDEVFRWIGGQPDAAEGVTAFLEKRPPGWRGRKTRDLAPGLAEVPDVDE